jgi:hypothetical protein
MLPCNVPDAIRKPRPKLPPVTFDLAKYGILGETTNHSVVGYNVHRPSVAELYARGAAAALPPGEHGRVHRLLGAQDGAPPKDKRIFEEQTTKVGMSNRPLPESSFQLKKQSPVNYLNCRDHIYVIDGLAGWRPPSLALSARWQRRQLSVGSEQVVALSADAGRRDQPGQPLQHTTCPGP